MAFKIDLVADKNVHRYYDQVIGLVSEQYKLAQQARRKGFDPELEVECQPVTDLADRAERIVGPKGIAKRYREVLKEAKDDRMNALFQIFREIIEEKWVKIPDKEKRIEQAIKSGLVLMTEGVVVSPLDGLPKVLISKNYDNSSYIDVYFAGPIRAAGGSATVIPLILADYARHLLDLDRYKPTQDEIERYVEEISLYQENLSRQYKMKEEEMRIIIEGCPVCVNGVPTEEKEVAVHRNLERIPSNRLRGGMCLVINEGVGLKAMKIMQWAKQLGLEWNWLEKIIKVDKTASKISELKPIKDFLEGIAAGRPLLAYPSRFGGFRLRYGRTRNSGCMAKAVNPAVMHLLDEFIAVGTHIKIERPGKAAQLFPCDSIDGPIVLLESGSVEKINSSERALAVKGQVKKIIFLGDVLVAVGDFRKTAHPLVPSPYVEEWWALEVKKALAEGKKTKVEVEKFLENSRGIGFEPAKQISLDLGIGLHPKFIHYYKGLSEEELKALVQAVGKAGLDSEGLKLDFSEETKKALEKIGLPHRLEDEGIVVEGELGQAFAETFGRENKKALSMVSGDVLESLSKISGLEIKDKCGTFVGARMGRPEQAKEREMKGNPHVLFPVGWYGGNNRSVNKAIQLAAEKYSDKLELEIALFKCPECDTIQPFAYCPECKARTIKLNTCFACGKIFMGEKCHCGGKVLPFNSRKIKIEKLLVDASANLRQRIPENVKGVKGMISGQKIPEPLEKGILRAKHDVHVFRDGTSRFELLNAPLTHFKPEEIGLSIAKAKELGYRVDVKGKPLQSEGQLVELFPQDMVINEKGGGWLLKMAKFVDDLLERFYGLPAYYKAQSADDLIGQPVIGLAPHTSAGIVGRVIGFTKSRLGWGHPYLFMATRRNFDGDQNSIMLLMDALLNFSQAYLSDKSGGRMDTPLVFTVVLNPMEIDNEVYDLEVCHEYPLDLYEKAESLSAPFLESVETVEQRLGSTSQYSGFGLTHSTSCFDAGPKQSMYVQLTTMEEKIIRQAELQNRIAAVDGKDALERVLRSHFFPDIIGNAHSFCKQKFRCTKCGSKYRRPPLKGVCLKCGNKLILTINEGGVRKYLGIAKKIINDYGLSNYLRQRIELTEKEVDSTFKSDKTLQKSLVDFV